MMNNTVQRGDSSFEFGPHEQNGRMLASAEEPVNHDFEENELQSGSPFRRNAASDHEIVPLDKSTERFPTSLQHVPSQEGSLLGI